MSCINGQEFYMMLQPWCDILTMQHFNVYALITVEPQLSQPDFVAWNQQKHRPACTAMQSNPPVVVGSKKGIKSQLITLFQISRKAQTSLRIYAVWYAPLLITISKTASYKTFITKSHESKAWSRVCGRAYRGLTVELPLLRNSVVCTVKSLSLFYLLFISWFVCTRRWCIDMLEIFYENQTCMCLDPYQK